MRHQDKYCSGSSSSCIGNLGAWKTATVYDNCTATEVCLNNDSSCNYSASCDITCGDGVIEGSETCDDGNASGGDGCSATCATESGWNCTGTPSSCCRVPTKNMVISQDTILCAGTWNDVSNIQVTGSGTSGDRLVVTCQNGTYINSNSSQTSNNRRAVYISGNYVTLENCNFDGHYGPSLDLHGDYAVIRANNFTLDALGHHEPNGTCLYGCNDAHIIDVDGAPGSVIGGNSASDGNVLTSNYSSTLGNTGNQWSGIGVDASNNLVIKNNDISGSHYHGVHLASGTGMTVSNNYIHHEGTHPTERTGKALFIGSGVTATVNDNDFRYNTGSHDIYKSGTASGDNNECETVYNWNDTGTTGCTFGTCGSGIQHSTEACDDGNTQSGDGCSATCTLEQVCGNGSVESPEECDDGDTSSGDGCSSSCAVEPHYSCQLEPSICTYIPYCGDNTINEPGEECDGTDLNLYDCTDLGYDTGSLICDGTCHFDMSGCSYVCGDGNVDPGEQCDGGACCTGSCTFTSAATECRASQGVCDVAEDCTGSSATCPVNGFASAATECRGVGGVCDVAEKCTGSSVSCPGDVKLTSECRASAGVCDNAENCNGVLNDCPSNGFKAASTICEVDATSDYECLGGLSCGADVYLRHQDKYCSGGSAGCDGALGAWKDGEAVVSDDCGVKYTCADNDDTCNYTCGVCGDSINDPDETCDDGDEITEQECDYGTQTCTLCNAGCDTVLNLTGRYCGDGTIDSGNGEVCDDGNTVAGDGCSSCAIDSGWVCSGQPSCCDNADNDNDGIGDACDPDDDNDGDADTSDCAPFDNSIYHGATESCDDVDSDCDGSLVDEFANNDGDSEPDCIDLDDDNDGDADTSDCAPFDATIYNGATESCDDVDSDCDGSLVDEFANNDGDSEPD
ncbi:DUF4215 domain-containing protein, partial [candidate division KSB1 bacterium]